MELELKHLAPYLPYNLIVKSEFYSPIKSIELTPFELSLMCNTLHKLKPILRPISDLTKEVECNGEKLDFTLFDAETRIIINYQDYRKEKINPYSDFKYWEMQVLLKWHFDVFGLIEKGLAIDINTLK